MTKLMTLRGQEPVSEPLHYKACGLDDVYLVNGFTREQIDGDDAVTIEDLDGLWKAIGLALVSERKTLTAKEARFLRRHMDLTQAELGAELRVTDQTVARWEKGETSISGPADLMLRVLFLASKCAQPEGGKVLAHLMEALDELRERDEEEHPAPIRLHHAKRWEPEKGRRELEYA